MKTNTLILSGALAAALLLLAVSPAVAATTTVPTQLSYQGFLTDSAGVPYGNTAPVVKTVNFRIWDVPIDGTASVNVKWSEQQLITVDKGYFSVILGQGSSLGDGKYLADLTSIFSGVGASDRYLETQLAQDANQATVVTLLPRTRFMASPYAMLSKAANGLVDSSGNYTMQADLAGGYSINGNLSASSASVSGLVKAGSITVSNSLTATTVSATTVAATTVAATTVTGFGTIPLGGIIMWSGATTAIPAGWALCNGGIVSGQTTPNLQDKFIVGAGSSYAVAITGGATTATLNANNLPTFSIVYHDTFGMEAGGDSVGKDANGAAFGPNFGFNGNGKDYDNYPYTFARFTTRTATGASGAPNAIDIRPPYYALAYIMRVQ
jgi:hypothetical protein